MHIRITNLILSCNNNNTYTHTNVHMYVCKFNIVEEIVTNPNPNRFMFLSEVLRACF